MRKSRLLSVTFSGVSAFAQASALAALRFYRGFVSPLKPAACRFYPTCSDYAMQALVRHGLLRGLLLALRRLLRCHPFNAGGYDPVP